MKYTKIFKDVIKLNTFIGTGNPNAKNLIVGKEVATDIENGDNKDLEKDNLNIFLKNSEYWKKNIENKLSQTNIPDWSIEKADNNPLFAFKGVSPINHKEGQTWRKYQKLHDYIFPEFSLTNKSEPHNFQERFFLTEMSILPAKTTKGAQKKSKFKEELHKRKETFFKSEFIQNFPIVILACGNYINGEELTKIFNVKFFEQKGISQQRYWIHYNDDKSKIVIHIRQLSSNVSNDLLAGIAQEINNLKNN